MDFNKGSSTINGSTIEDVAIELMNQLDILEKSSSFNYVTVEPDTESEQCDFRLSFPITSTFGVSTGYTADQYVTDGSFTNTDSDLSSTNLIDAVVELWGIIAVAIKNGQQLSSYSCNVQINSDITGKVLSITVTDFPCTFTLSGSTLVMAAKMFLSGSQSNSL